MKMKSTVISMQFEHKNKHTHAILPYFFHKNKLNHNAFIDHKLICTKISVQTKTVAKIYHLTHTKHKVNTD